jgi:hypothetical protein
MALSQILLRKNLFHSWNAKLNGDWDACKTEEGQLI